MSIKTKQVRFLERKKKENILEVPGWLSGLSIQCCHCRGLGRYGGAGLIPWPRNSHMPQVQSKKKQKQKQKQNLFFVCVVDDLNTSGTILCIVMETFLKVICSFLPSWWVVSS